MKEIIKLSTHPNIVRLTKELWPKISQCIGDKGVHLRDLADFLKTEKTEGLTYRGTYPYSYQLDYIITNLILKGRIEEYNGFITLTSYGKNLVDKEN